MTLQGRKILYISLTRTGSTAYAAAVASAISQSDATIITSTESQHAFDKADHTIDTYKGYFSFIYKSLAFMITSWQLLSQYKSESALVYFPVFHPWNLIIAIWAGVKNIPVVTTIHDYHTHTGEKNKLIEHLQKIQMSISDYVVFLSENQRSIALKDNPTKKSKYKLLIHPPLPVSQKQKLDHNRKLKFLFLGRIKAYKGYKLILEAAQSAQIESITIAGSGDSIPSNNSKITVINEYLSDDKVMDLLSSHHVLLLPYTEASQSGILMLGMAANVPMIVSDLPGLDEQANKNTCLWISPNATSLRAAMERLQQDSDLYHKLKDNMESYNQEYQKKYSESLQSLLDDLHRL